MERVPASIHPLQVEPVERHPLLLPLILQTPHAVLAFILLTLLLILSCGCSVFSRLDYSSKVILGVVESIEGDILAFGEEAEGSDTGAGDVDDLVVGTVPVVVVDQHCLHFLILVVDI